MKKQFLQLPFLFLLACLTLTGCSQTASPTQETTPTATTEPELPVIIVDDEHRAFESENSLEYEIPAGAGFVLDASGYEFSIPAGDENETPNMIQLRVDQNSYYGYRWKEGVARYTLTSKTLGTLGNSNPFAGLSPGLKVAVAIGYQRDTANFSVYWAGIINVGEQE